MDGQRGKGARRFEYGCKPFRAIEKHPLSGGPLIATTHPLTSPPPVI